MSRRVVVRRIWLPTLLTAATSTAIAIVVIFATEWKTNPWAWIAVGVLTVLAFLAMHLGCTKESKLIKSLQKV